MINSLIKPIHHFFTISVPDNDKKEFNSSIDKVNVGRAKITSATFILLETVMLIISFIVKKDIFHDWVDMIYIAMYLLMLTAMILFLLIFIRLDKNIAENGARISVIGIIFSSFILWWCAGISVIDQLSSGQITVYTVAILSISAAPIFNPLTLLRIYMPCHLMFIGALLYFSDIFDNTFFNSTNSTTFIIISMAISYMRYKNRVEDFNNKKIIEKNTRDLKELNRKLEEANQKLEKRTQTDSLTGIFNRSVFDITIKSEWNRCRHLQEHLSLIMIDIDFFKTYNDTLGHQAGDDCLKMVAEVLTDCMSLSSNIVTRYGGEEFAVILPYTDKKNACEIAEKLRSSVEKLKISHPHSSISKFVTISSGVCTVIPDEHLLIHDFIHTADKALYESKRGNRNKVVSAQL
jgi:diguanylate cyclase (GGDEF)-like protein